MTSHSLKVPFGPFSHSPPKLKTNKQKQRKPHTNTIGMDSIHSTGSIPAKNGGMDIREKTETDFLA